MYRAAASALYPGPASMSQPGNSNRHYEYAEGHAESNRQTLTVTGAVSPPGRGGLRTGPREAAQGRAGPATAREGRQRLPGAQRGAPGRASCGGRAPWPKDMLPWSGTLTARRAPGGQNSRDKAHRALLGAGDRHGGRAVRRGERRPAGLPDLRRVRAGLPRGGHRLRQAAVIRPGSCPAEYSCPASGLTRQDADNPFGELPCSPKIIRPSVSSPECQLSGRP